MIGSFSMDFCKCPDQVGSVTFRVFRPYVLCSIRRLENPDRKAFCSYDIAL